MEDLLEVGTIVAPQGMQGQVRVLSESDFPERFEKPGKRWLKSPVDGSIQEIQLVSGRYIPGGKLYVVTLDGVDTRDSAEALKGYKLLVDKSDRPRLKKDEYHVEDLINLEVYHELTGEKIGVVTNIFWAGNDLLEVSLNADGQPAEEKPNKKILVPFVKEIVPVVNLETKRVAINPPPGLMEING
ncbi:MAG: Ribosome maturation factor RimM [Chroococcopsis gigantea SAG 12.99]|jgi:16S rRNA processing protein RimM|nr:ribosome maturation factor RimM [Chlorogloea purpurea SAG 13.99]MDV2999622.1 Ribosome maturation factor RimM [Chroococcopsis gigantea SAG 12.99]